MQLKHFRAVLLLGILGLNLNLAWAQSPDRATLLGEIESLRSQLKTKEDEFLAPSPEDCTAYAEFLGKKDAGLIRILPREKYDAPKNTLVIRGGGAYYSFTRLTHEYGHGSDIELQGEHLSVGFAGVNYGLLANLGDIPLETLTLEASIVRALTAYAPPTTAPGARNEYRRSSEGLLLENVLYKSRIPAVVNNTYLLRSIDYDTSDVLVAFRVVRRDTDGSLILVWKLLKKYPVPQLEREKEAGNS